MKKSTVFLTVILCLSGIGAYAQSLGDLAIEEQKRRDAISTSRIIVLESAPAVASGKEILAEAEENEDASDGTENPRNTDAEKGQTFSEATNPNEITDLKGKTESYWRSTISDARNKLKQLEDEEKQLTSQRNALQLQNDRTNETRRGTIKDAIDKTRQAQEQNRKNLEQARKELQSLQNEARSSNVPPGWIR